MTPLEQAQEILRIVPLPDDAEARIDALFEAASEDDRPLFAWIYEGLSVAMSADDPVATGPITLELTH